MTNGVNGDKVRVLLIDDQELIAEALKAILDGEDDIEFFYCQHSTEAIKTATEVKPTVILQDLSMPEIDGLTLVRYFRANPATAQVPLIVLSGNEEPVTKAQAFEYGANDYLVKFPDKVEVLARLRYHSGAYRRLQERNQAYKTLQKQQRVIQSDLEEAATYVQSLFPQKLTGKVESSWIYIPSANLGGDSFGYTWLDDDHLAIFLIDVCGHGVGAALLSISVVNILSSGALSKEHLNHPAELLEALNKAFPMEKHGDRFFTAWYGVYNVKTRELSYSSAGHPPALLMTKELEIEELRTEGFVVGGMVDPQFDEKKTTVPPGAILYVYSDGIFELETGDGQHKTYPEFLESMKACDHPPTVDEIYSRAADLNITDGFDDDFTLVRLAFD